MRSRALETAGARAARSVAWNDGERVEHCRGAVTVASPARRPGPGGTPWARTPRRSARASTHGDQRRREPPRGEADAGPGAGCRTGRQSVVRGRRPVGSRAPRQRTRQRWAVGVEHVGRSLVRRGQAPVGTCLPTPLPGVVWSAGARRWRRWHHDRPCFAPRFPLVTVTSAKVELRGCPRTKSLNNNVVCTNRRRA
jgi:hypothetical protein